MVWNDKGKPIINNVVLHRQSETKKEDKHGTHVGHAQNTLCIPKSSKGPLEYRLTLMEEIKYI